MYLGRLTLGPHHPFTLVSSEPFYLTYSIPECPMLLVAMLSSYDNYEALLCPLNCHPLRKSLILFSHTLQTQEIWGFM